VRPRHDAQTPIVGGGLVKGEGDGDRAVVRSVLGPVGLGVVGIDYWNYDYGELGCYCHWDTLGFRKLLGYWIVGVLKGSSRGWEEGDMCGPASGWITDKRRKAMSDWLHKADSYSLPGPDAKQKWRR